MSKLEKLPNSADYQPWDENYFAADIDVQHLTPVQRWMYRTLCQTAFVCKTRPYLPVEDKQLWKLAGCDSLKQWLDNKESVLELFEYDEQEGVQVLRRNRIVRDWNRIMDARETDRANGSEGGVKSAAARAAAKALRDGQPPLDPASSKINQGSKEVRKEESKEAIAASTSTNNSKAGIREGEPGYYDPNMEHGHIGAERTFTMCRTAWKNKLGASATCQSFFGDWKKSWEAVCRDMNTDLLVAAFELWIEEEGQYNPSPSPVHDFIRGKEKKYDEYAKKVLPLNTVGKKYVEPVISEELAAEQLAAHKKQWGIDLPALEAELQNEEAALEMFRGGFTPEEVERTEKKILTLRADIEQEKAYLAGRK